MNLIETLQGFITPDVIGKAAGMLGESESGVGKAMSGVLPGLLASVISKGSTEQGADDVLGMIREGNFGGGNLEGVSNLFGNGFETNPMMVVGKNLLGGLLGDKAGLLGSAIASFSGVKESSATSLMSMAAPLVMGLLGKEVASKGLNASGLMGLLAGQKDSVAALLPAGLGSVLGFGSFSGIGEKVAGAFSGATADVKDLTAGTPATASNTFGAPKPTYTEEKGGSNWWLWLLGLAALVIGGFYFLRGCNETPKVTETAEATIDTISAGADAMMESVSASIKSVTGADLGSLMARKLADGTELNIPESGVEGRLLAFIEDSTKAVDKTTWFDFDRLLFDTGKATLKFDSSGTEEQLTNIVAILKAYPKVNLKIGGYTDNTGDAKANLKLSGDRAKTVMDELVKRGIDAKRLASEGYGDQFPVASNDTPEGRQQNRRVSCRVTAK
ncbi:MAG: DUF937 domain-containing protein [Cytophagales bacterium]|nr:DUF937 domain-containing protein [Cytophagales bacterium]